jgi:hypothetical protein
MVALNDMARVSALYAELRNLEEGDGFLAGGGPITAMIIGNPNRPLFPPNGPGGVTVSTVDFTYPSSMLDNVRSQIAARLTAIRNELSSLGVTQ